MEKSKRSSGERKTFSVPLATLRKVRLGAICLVIGIVLGVLGSWFLRAYNPADASTQTATAVFGRLVEQNELVSVSQSYAIVDKVSDTNRLFNIIDIPFTDNSFWYRYVGTIKAGVSLETADVEENGSTVTVTLDAPYIVSNDPDMEVSGVLEERNNILNPIHVEDVDEFQRQCEKKSEEDAVAGGLLDEAKEAAEKNIKDLFYAALGDGCEVKIVWRESGE